MVVGVHVILMTVSSVTYNEMHIEHTVQYSTEKSVLGNLTFAIVFKKKLECDT